MNEKIRVTVLIENTSEYSLAFEHGLSLFIEYAGRQILLDAGSSDAFWDNTEAMGISLIGLDAYVLSHGHYDHSGGFEKLFRMDPTAMVYARKEALDVYLSARGGMHAISVPRNVASHGERFLLTDGITEIFPRIYLVPHNTSGLDKIGEKARLYKIQEDQIVPDDFVHEQSLVIDTDNGLVIFNSCSHAGAENIVREAKNACRQNWVHAYVGGLHLKGKRDNKEICIYSDAEIDEMCRVFRREGINRIYTGHCTGAVAFHKLRERLGDRVQRLSTGIRFEL